MENSTSFFASWGITLGISILFSILFIYKKVAKFRDFKTIVDNFEKEIAIYISDIEIDDLKQTQGGRELLELLNLEKLTTPSQDHIPDSPRKPSSNLQSNTRSVRERKGLGERHQRILDFVWTYQTANRQSPSATEISKGTGILLLSVVNYYLNQLEKMGLIEFNNKTPRGVHLFSLSPSKDTLLVPILGPIAAGPFMIVPEPGVNYMNNNEYDAVTIARNMLPANEKGNDLYALEVKGDSMIDAMINDGDIVVMKPSAEARNGEMVAVRVNDEYTLKYFYNEKNRYRLQPANPNMKSIVLKKTEQPEINGKVVMVIRKMDRQPAEKSGGLSYAQ